MPAHDGPAKLNARQFGFTLIELLIVVAIVGVIAIVAYPNYVDHVRKTERKTAIGKTLEVASRVEQFRTQRLQYPSDAADLAGFALDEIKYDYEVAAVTVDGATVGYTVTVTPQGDQAQDECGTLVYANSGDWTFDNSLTEDDCL